MYKLAISTAVSCFPSKRCVVNSSAFYGRFGMMTSTNALTHHFRRGGGPSLAAQAFHQMLCFLYFGDRWPPVAVHGVKGDAFQSGGRFVLLYIVAVSVFPPPKPGVWRAFLHLKAVFLSKILPYLLHSDRHRTATKRSLGARFSFLDEVYH